MIEDIQSNSDIWMVRAGRGGEFAARFLDESIVAIGWGHIGDITASTPDDEIRRMMDVAYPGEKSGSRASWAGAVRRFVKEVEIGDPVVTYDNESRLYHLGEIRSDAEQRTFVHADGEKRLEFCREVKWLDEVPRDSLLLSTRNSLGIPLTISRKSAAASADLRRRASQSAPNAAQDDETPPPDDETDETETLQGYIDKSDLFIEDAIAKLDWEQLQELVAGIIRAMGYKTRVSSPGPDRGVDIFASPDGLGLSEPRIFVEVKHRPNVRIGSQDVRSFLGGRQRGDRCLYVSVGGFTQEAKYEADRSQIPITLIAMSQLRELLVEYYEALDSDTRDLVPLKRVYLPAMLSDS